MTYEDQDMQTWQGMILSERTENLSEGTIEKWYT